MSDLTKVMNARDQVARLLRSNSNVSAVAIENDESGNPVVAVHLVKPDTQRTLPPKIDGQPIKYTVTGRYRAF